MYDTGDFWMELVGKLAMILDAEEERGFNPGLDIKTNKPFLMDLSDEN